MRAWQDTLVEEEAPAPAEAAAGTWHPTLPMPILPAT
jgi:hypothetical protein